MLTAEFRLHGIKKLRHHSTIVCLPFAILRILDIGDRHILMNVLLIFNTNVEEG